MRKKKQQTTFALIKPDAFQKKQEIVQLAKSSGFTIAQERELTLSYEQAQRLFKDEKQDDLRWLSR